MKAEECQKWRRLGNTYHMNDVRRMRGGHRGGGGHIQINILDFIIECSITRQDPDIHKIESSSRYQRVTGGLHCIILNYEARLCYSKSQAGQRNTETCCYGQLSSSLLAVLHICLSTSLLAAEVDASPTGRSGELSILQPTNDRHDSCHYS